VPDAQEIYAYLVQKPVSPASIQRAVELGMLPRGALKDGIVYQGYCRNVTCAMWDAANNEFWYHRTDKGRRESIPYPGDREDWDVFVPVAEADPYDAGCYFGERS